MKRFLTTLVIALINLAAYSQHINYQGSLEQASNKAKAENKPLFINIYSPVPKDKKVDGKTVTYKSGLDAPEVIKLYNENFINYKISGTDSASAALRKKYRITFLPTYLFTNADGELIYKTFGNSSTTTKYTAMRAKVMAMLSSGRNLPVYNDKYNKGLRSAEFLKDYILLREELGYTDNADLIDEYVDNLSVKSLNDYNQVLFILKAGPYAYGKAYNLIFINKKIVDSVYKREPVPVRAIIDLRIVDNTMLKAIREKNIAIAQQATRCMAAMFKSDYRKGMIASTKKMLQYYQGVNDTANYFRQAVYFYDNNYMNISADSAKKIDQKNIQNLQKYVFTKPKTDTAKSATGQAAIQKTVSTPVKVTSTVNFTINTTATTLNNAAYTFYTYGTRNQNYLTRAMLWAKRAIELSPKSPYYDTFAHLLYRLGFYSEAAIAQTEAINLAQKTNGNINYYKAELNKIKKRQL